MDNHLSVTGATQAIAHLDILYNDLSNTCDWSH